MKRLIDLNCDMGEAFGSYQFGADQQIIRYISSANIACGFHAGDPLVMDDRVRLCKEHNVAIGAHPGFPDLMGFGRRPMMASPQEVSAYICYQLGALLAFAHSHDTRVEHVKPHGALYNMAAADEQLALAVAEAVAMVDDRCILVGLAGSLLVDAGRAKGLLVAQEVFADRGYRADGSLIPRGQSGDIIHSVDEAAQRIVTMIETGTIPSHCGSLVQVTGQTICLHGDTPGATDYAQAIRSKLEALGIEIAPMRAVVA